MGNPSLECGHSLVSRQGFKHCFGLGEYSMKKIVSVIIVTVILNVFFAGLTPKIHADDAILVTKPKLVIAIVADQFRYDYLLRFKDEFRGGLFQLMKNGAVYTNARYEHYPTFTAVGHAVLLTGAYPSVHGIVGNLWYDRNNGKQIQAAADDTVRLVGGADGPGSSPRNLLVSTIGDEMKIASQGQSRVFGISLKDYSGIMATGHMADAVYWFDTRSGNFVTSTYFQSDLPEWLKAYNKGRNAERFKDVDWIGTRLPKEPGPRLYGMLLSTPFGNDLVEEVAEELIKSEGLGRGPNTDLLVISLSSNDYVGHQSGPDSRQVREISIETDKLLGKLFKFVDSHLGLDNATIMFTADHGVAPMPETNVKRRMPGGRVNLSAIRDAVQMALAKKYGDNQWIVAMPEDSIYLNQSLIRDKNLSRHEVEQTAAQAALAVPHVFRVYTREQLLRGNASGDIVERRMARSYSQQRGADLYVLLEPYYLSAQISTNHGSAFGYDTHVPLIFMGAGIKAGMFHASISMNDVAPTLATLLEIEMPSGAEGRILEEMFKSR